MPTATRDLYTTSAKLPKLRTGYQIAVSAPSPSTPRSAVMPMGTTRELPMPVVTSINSLAQAQATLQHCATKLSKSWQNNPARSSPPSSPMDAYGKRHFQQWLEQWEQAFTAFLSYYMPHMRGDELTRSRILKANHLSCTILASDGRSFNTFDSEFQAIVDLAGAILQTRAPNTLRSDSNTLDVREPLHVVAARCSRVSTRNQAMELLNRFSAR